MMIDEVERFQRRFFDMIASADRLTLMSRAKELQIQAIADLAAIIDSARQVKQKAISESDELGANVMLGLESVSQALSSELSMLVAFKDDDARSAWEHLVDAQMAVGTALQAGIERSLDRYAEKLQMYERLLFPTMSFFSPGLTIIESKCTICGASYDSCDHIVGRPYMGEICGREITKADVREISLVTEPANKRARVYAIHENGVKIDILSLRETPVDEDEVDHKEFGRLSDRGNGDRPTLSDSSLPS